MIKFRYEKAAIVAIWLVCLTVPFVSWEAEAAAEAPAVTRDQTGESHGVTMTARTDWQKSLIDPKKFV